MSLLTAAAAMVQIAGLRKRFGRLTVLDHVDAVVPRGQVTAVVGPNAAGKSTLIKCLLGLVRPDAGEVRIEGEPVGEDATYRRAIGYMPQGAPFPENLRGRELLGLLCALRREEKPDLDLIQRFALERELDKPIRALSGGTRQKLNAVIAFLFRPSLAILDEPTAGLDPIASGILKETIAERSAAGVTFILTSHILSELDEVAQEIIFLVEGRVRFQGAMDHLRRSTGEQRLERALARLLTARVA
jgi:Cu-processing system ATP-binding protein